MPDFKPFVHFFFYYQSLHRCEDFKLYLAQVCRAGFLYPESSFQVSTLGLREKQSNKKLLSPFHSFAGSRSAADAGRRCSLAASLWLAAQCGLPRFCCFARAQSKRCPPHPQDITHLCNLGFLWPLTLLPNSSLSSPYIEPASNKAHLKCD